MAAYNTDHERAKAVTSIAGRLSSVAAAEATIYFPNLPERLLAGVLAEALLPITAQVQDVHEHVLRDTEALLKALPEFADAIKRETRSE